MASDQARLKAFVVGIVKQTKVRLSFFALRVNCYIF